MCWENLDDAASKSFHSLHLYSFQCESSFSWANNHLFVFVCIQKERKFKYQATGPEFIPGQGCFCVRWARLQQGRLTPPSGQIRGNKWGHTVTVTTVVNSVQLCLAMVKINTYRGHMSFVLFLASTNWRCDSQRIYLGCLSICYHRCAHEQGTQPHSK